MTTLAAPTHRSTGVRLLIGVALVTLLGFVVGFFSGGWLIHHDSYVSQQGDEFTGKVVGVKDDSICIAQGDAASCALPLYAERVHPSVGDTVRAVELEAMDGHGTTTSVYYVLSSTG